MIAKFREFAEKRRAKQDEDFMQLALLAAESAKKVGDLAIGAVLLLPNGKTMAEGDTSYTDQDHTAHAVMNVLRKASGMLGKSLDKSIIYTTLEPCLMCAMAAHLNGVQEIVFGVYDSRYGFISSKTLLDHSLFGIASKGGVLAEECVKYLPKDWNYILTEII